MKDLKKTIQACQKNDRKAQKALYEHYYGFFISICYRYESNEQDAVAMVNASFLKVLNNLDAYDTDKPFIPWLKRITLNTAIDQLRKKHRLNGQMVLLDENEWEQKADVHYNVDVEEEDVTYEDLLALLNSLPEPERTVFNLYAIDEFPHKEIAALLNISERSSKRHLSNAREQLKKKLSAPEFEMKGAS